MYLLLASSGSAVVGTLVDVGGWVTAFGALVVVVPATLLLLVSGRMLFARSSA